MTDDSFDNQLPDDLKPIADALREGRPVADGHLLDRVLHRIRATARPRPRLWLSMPRLAVMASLAVAVLIGARLSHVNVVQGVANLASTLTTTSSTSPTGSAANDTYCPDHQLTCHGAFTPGFWKNHLTQTGELLPVNLGPYTVSTTTQAYDVLVAMNCGSSTSQGAVGCLAGELLAAKLNVKNGNPAPACVATAISSADSLLTIVTRTSPPGTGYIGPSATYALTAAQRTQAVSLATTLDNFNNNKSC